MVSSTGIMQLKSPMTISILDQMNQTNRVTNPFYDHPKQITSRSISHKDKKMTKTSYLSSLRIKDETETKTGESPRRAKQ
jgi:hypothetical protein